MTIVNDDSRIINKLEASLTDDARFIIYDHHMFIVQDPCCHLAANSANTLNYFHTCHTSLSSALPWGQSELIINFKRGLKSKDIVRGEQAR
jgi:hypothetical protein